MRGFDFDKALVALQNELHCFAYKLTADKDEAENLLQETMLRTLDNKDKFDSGTNFKGWMYTIMRNAGRLSDAGAFTSYSHSSSVLP